MGAVRNKLVFWLVVYFAGFATAIYCLAPAPDAEAYRSSEKGFVYSVFKSDKFAKSFNVKMRKGMRYSQDAAKRLSAYLKEKFDKHQAMVAKK